MRILTIILSLACVSAYALEKNSILEEYKAKAEAGDAESQFIYGGFLSGGLGICNKADINLEESVKWTRMSAEGGYGIKAYYSLALSYEKGEGTPCNIVEAYAYYNLGVISLRDIIEKRIIISGLVVNATMEQNLYYSCLEKISALEKQMTSSQVKEAQQRSKKLYEEITDNVSKKQFTKFQKDAEKGDVEAQYNLGCCYYSGTGVKKDYAEAVRWYRKAAERGNIYAQFNLGEAYRKGEGVPQDSAAALMWQRRAAEQGDAEAQFNV